MGKGTEVLILSCICLSACLKTPVNGEAYSGKMPTIDFLPEPALDRVEPESTMTATDLNMLVSSRFNLDLVHDLELPIANATYAVYATLGDYKSNVLTIKVVAE